VQLSVTPGQLSENIAAKVTMAPLGLVHSATGDGHEIDGFCISFTMMLALQELDNCSGSVTVSITGFVPRWYGGSGDWLSVTGSPSESDEPLSIDTDDAMLWLGSVGTVLSMHFAVGGVPGSHGLFIVVLVSYWSRLPKVFVSPERFPKWKRHAAPVPD
jgi:hypothetical protein